MSAFVTIISDSYQVRNARERREVQSVSLARVNSRKYQKKNEQDSNLLDAFMTKKTRGSHSSTHSNTLIIHPFPYPSCLRPRRGRKGRVLCWVMEGKKKERE